MKVSRKVLKYLAMIVWYIGFIMLSIKSYALFEEAYDINSNLLYISSFLVVGLVLGLVKTKYIFIPACLKNLKRIDSLENPKLWQFYRIPFFLFLFSMITLGAYLSHLAQGNYIFLVSVGIVDMALAIALLYSGFKSSWDTI